MPGDEGGAAAQGGAGEPAARERVLAAAGQLFAGRSFDRTPTAQIAAAAGVPHGLIFCHFKTKLDLLLAVVSGDQLAALTGLLPEPAPGTPASSTSTRRPRRQRPNSRPSSARRPRRPARSGCGSIRTAA